jgi:ELWxxDGT repeat protein
MVADIFVGETSSHAGGFTPMNDLFYFSAQDGSAKRRDAFSYMLEPGQLWVSDGTAAGTRRVNHVESSLSTYNVLSGLGSFTPAETVLFFRANGGLMQTDGTAEGTVVLKSGYPGQIVLWQGNPLFTFSLYQSPQNNELWLYDVSRRENFHLHTFPHLMREAWATHLLPFAGQVFFIAGDETGNQEWWSTSGTAESTDLFYDINPHPMSPLIVGDTLFFVADDGVHGRELWKTNGTPESTRLVKDIAR